MALKGIDISQWQENVNFVKVKQSGIDFCIFREGYRNTLDRYFLTYVKGAKNANIPIHGVYHFCYAINETEVLKQAKTCVANVKKAGLGKDIIIFFDFQYDTVKKAKQRGVTLGKKQCISFTKVFCDYILSQGYKTGIYCNLDYYNNMYDKETINKYDYFWFAQYSGATNPSVKCSYYQYTSSGKVKGINGTVDMNYYYGQQTKKEVKTNTTSTVVSKIDFSQYYGKISNSGHDENGSYKNGKAGDNTGTQWEIRIWYNRPWDCILRYPDEKVGNLIAELSIEAAKNNLIGYDQWQRNTYWQHLKASNYRPSQITVPCEADCSAGVIANVKAVGYLLNINALKNISATYTGNMKSAFKKAGFQVLTDQKYLNSYDYLKPGDILLNEIHHTATNLGIGKKSNYKNSTSSVSTPVIITSEPIKPKTSTINKKPIATGIVTASALNVRTWAGTENPNIKSYPVLYKNNRVDICDTIKDKNKENWYYIRIKGSIYGFVNAKYIKKD